MSPQPRLAVVTLLSTDRHVSSYSDSRFYPLESLEFAFNNNRDRRTTSSEMRKKGMAGKANSGQAFVFNSVEKLLGVPALFGAYGHDVAKEPIRLTVWSSREVQSVGRP